MSRDFDGWEVDLSEAVAEGLRPLVAEQRLTLEQWAREHFHLSAESSYVEQDWDPWPFQRGLMAVVGGDDVQEVTVKKSARVGYALALDTPIPTPTGWTSMGGLCVGDRVFDENGRPCSVRYVSEVFTDHDCFEVEFCDGTKVIADRGHRWYVEADRSLEYLSGQLGKGRTGRPKRGLAVTKSGVIDTGEMARITAAHSGRSALAVPCAGALDLPELELPMPPYTLGLWLGDGHMVSPRITQHRSDVGTAAFIEAEGIRVSIQYTDPRYPNNATYFLDCAGGRSDPSPWAKIMRSMGVLGNKHIPPIYLRASARQRLELLRGLMDSDGNLTGARNEFAEFVNTNKAIACGVHELVCSLGMKASLRIRQPKLPHHLLQYRVTFRPTPESNPFHLPRKAGSVAAPHRPTITHRRRVVAVRPVASVPVCCIEVDSASRLFLCSRSMLPTHNTKILLACIGYTAESLRRNQALWQPTDEDAEDFMKSELEPMLRDVKVMRRVFPNYLARHKDNTLTQKKFLGSILRVRGGKAAKNYRRFSIDRGYLDETDGFDRDIEKEGDCFSLAKKRTEGATFPKIVAGSTPKLRGFSLIDDRFDQAEHKFSFCIRCPHCSGWHPITWGGKDIPHGFKWQDRDAETVMHLCPHCASLISQAEYLRAAPGGMWRTADGSLTFDEDGRFFAEDGQRVPAPKHIAVHVWTAYSPAVSWASIVSDFLAAFAKMQEGDDTKMKTFTNTTLGLSWEGEVERLDEDDLKNRAEPFPLKRMPRGCLLLLAGIDTQDNRVEIGVWGLGLGGEMWTIDHRVIFGNPAKDEIWAELSEFLREQQYAHQDGEPQKIFASAIDSGGHHADAVYAFAHAHRSIRVFAVKGSSHQERSIDNGNTKVSYNFNGRREKHGPTLWMVGTNLAKDRFQARLEVQTPGPGYVHLALDLSDEWFKQLAGEVRAVRRMRGGTESRWTARRARVEVRDCLTYAIWLEERLALWEPRRAKFWSDLAAALVPDEPAPEVRPVEQPRPQPAPRQANPFTGGGWGFGQER